ncbi:MAG: hypothetical protein ACXWMN_04400 [Candidatus Limnocylindria bacterium]
MTSPLDTVVLATPVTFFKGWDLWGNFTTIDLIAATTNTPLSGRMPYGCLHRRRLSASSQQPAASNPQPAASDDVTDTPVQAFTPAERRRLIARGLLRALAATTVLVALYYLSPLDHIDSVPLGVSLAFALLVLLGVTIWQLRAIGRAAQPGLRAIEA